MRSGTHGVEIDAPAAAVWPWIAQIGADKGGFYSYQWLENLAGCDVRNAERVHPEWEVKVGDGLRLHPEMPAIPVVDVATRLAYGVAIEPIGFAMDRRMLLGVKERAER